MAIVTADNPHYQREREQWKALLIEPLDMLPPEALIASIRYLAGQLLELTSEPDKS